MERSLFRFLTIFQRIKRGTHLWRIVNNCLKYYLLIAQYSHDYTVIFQFNKYITYFWFAPFLIFSYYENIQGFPLLKKPNSQLILHYQETNHFNWYFTSSQELFHCMLVNQIIISKTLNLVCILTYLLALDKLFILYQDLAALICYPKQNNCSSDKSNRKYFNTADNNILYNNKKRNYKIPSEIVSFYWWLKENF